MDEMLSGGCRCGQLRYRVTGRQIAGVICHCKGCQRRTGGSTGVMFVMRDRTTLTGHYGSYLDPQTSLPIRMLFCETCGSSIAAFAGSYPDLQIILAASLDEPKDFAPQLHMWVSEKLPWVTLDDTLPRFEEHPDWESLGGVPDLGRFLAPPGQDDAPTDRPE